MHPVALRQVSAILAFVLVLVAITAASAAPSEELTKIIASLQTDKYNLDVSKLPKNIGLTGAALAGNGKLERYTLPVEPNTADMFEYQVFFNLENSQYWVIRSGGFADRTEIYGPVKFTPKSK